MKKLILSTAILFAVSILASKSYAQKLASDQPAPETAKLVQMASKPLNVEAVPQTASGQELSQKETVQKVLPENNEIAKPANRAVTDQGQPSAAPVAPAASKQNALPKKSD